MTDTVFDEALGVDLGGSKLLLRYRDQWLRFDTGAGFDAGDLTHILRQFIEDQAERPAALGIAIPGLVERDVVRACDVLPGIVGWDPRQALSGAVASLSMVNDAKAALHATTFDLERGKTAVTVMVGSAVGCGIVADGMVLRGACGWAGELGYWPVQDAEGRSLRLDELAGGRYMAERLAVDGARLASLTARGDERARDVVTEGGRALGAALAGVVNLLNPHRLSVGGGALRLAGYWSEAQARMRALAIPDILSACEIQNVHEKDDIVAMGAARLALVDARG